MPEPTTRRAAGGPRNRPAWVVAGAAGGAAVLLIGVIAVVGWLWISSSGDESAAVDTAGDGSGTIVLTDAEADTSASCMVPSAERMRAENDLAFDGTVTAVDDGGATFAVQRWYAGGQGAAAVRLERVAEMPGLLYTPDLQDGRRYLVVAADGLIRYCDPSGPYTPELEALFVGAFGDPVVVGS